MGAFRICIRPPALPVAFSVSKNHVIPTKRSAWRDLRSNKSICKNHDLRAFSPEMRRSLDFARDDKLAGYGSKRDYFDFFDSLKATGSAGGLEYIYALHGPGWSGRNLPCQIRRVLRTPADSILSPCAFVLISAIVESEESGSKLFIISVMPVPIATPALPPTAVPIGPATAPPPDCMRAPVAPPTYPFR